MVKSMPSGAVIVDLAVEAGGNVEGAELGRTVTKHEVTIVGHANVPSRVAQDASTLFAKNLLNFMTPLVDGETQKLNIDWEDEIIQGTLVCRDGSVVHPALTGQETKVGADKMAAKAAEVAGSTDPFLFLFTVFVLAVFVGFYVVWSVTPALHSPLMSVTNAISSVIIVGALIAAGPADLSFSKVMGFLAVALASVNILGGSL